MTEVSSGESNILISLELFLQGDTFEIISNPERSHNKPLCDWKLALVPWVYERQTSITNLIIPNLQQSSQYYTTLNQTAYSRPSREQSFTNTANRENAMSDIRYYVENTVERNKDIIQMKICQLITNKHENIYVGVYRNDKGVPGWMLSR
jgi:hypothetical protein